MLLGGIAVICAVLAVLLCIAAGAFSGWLWLVLLPLGFAGSYLVLVVLAFLFLWACTAPVDLSVPQTKDSRFHRILVKLYAPAIMGFLRARIHTEGLEKTPKDGRFFLVCNHINDLDPVTLLAYFKNSQLAFVTKRENMRMIVVGKLMHKLQCQPVNRENDREALKTVLACVKILQEDKASVAAFPEGYTSRDGKLHHFRHGIFKIAQKTKVPIVICTIQNSNKVFKNFLHFRPTPMQLHLLEVMQPEDYEGMTTVQIGEYVHARMAADLGPELVAEA